MMILFPDLREEQLLGDAIGLYDAIMNYLAAYIVTRSLFGNQNLSVSYGFPIGLEYLLSVFPHGHKYTVQELINFLVNRQ